MILSWHKNPVRYACPSKRSPERTRQGAKHPGTPSSTATGHAGPELFRCDPAKAPARQKCLCTPPRHLSTPPLPWKSRAPGFTCRHLHGLVGASFPLAINSICPPINQKSTLMVSFGLDASTNIDTIPNHPGPGRMPPLGLPRHEQAKHPLPGAGCPAPQCLVDSCGHDRPPTIIPQASGPQADPGD